MQIGKGGVDIANEKFKNFPNLHFVKCSEPRQLDINDQKASLIICLETLEHIPETMLEDYLQKLSHLAKGYIFVSVPNEKGPLFLMKYLIKKLFFRDAENFNFLEVMACTIGYMKFVKRHEHKGFDYNVLYKRLRFYFKPVKISGIPLRWFPKFLNTVVQNSFCKL